MPASTHTSASGSADKSMRTNRLLESLPWDLRQKLEPDLVRVDLRSGELLHEEGARIKAIWFPTSCLASGVVDYEQGASVEATLMGTDGFTGIGALLGSKVSLQKILIQVPGEALRMDVESFHSHLEDPRFREVLSGYAAQAYRIVGHSVGCVIFHPIEQRLTRWLLMVQDALEGDEFRLTQEFIGIMLGSHRPTVTLAEGILSEAGLVERRRGVIRLLDREGLMAAACECYEAQKLDKNKEALQESSNR